MEKTVVRDDDRLPAKPAVDSWQRRRLIIEEEWTIVLTGEAVDLVPPKLPISPSPVRRAA